MIVNSFEQMGVHHAYVPGSTGDILNPLLQTGTMLAEGNPALLGALLLMATALAARFLNRA